MSELARLQADFSAALAAPAATLAMPAGLRDTMAGPAQTARRFALYRNNVRLARMNALAGAYPVIRNIVGEEFFTGLAREYAGGHESAGGDLNAYGARFAAFLGSFAPVAELPYLPDVARLEWQAHLAYYAADAAPFDANRLAGVPEGQWAALRFRLHPATTALRSGWPVARIWEINQPAYCGEMAMDLRPQTTYALVHRPVYDVRVAPLLAGEYSLITALAADCPLGDALAQAAAAQPDFDPAAALQALVRRALIRDFSFEEKSTHDRP